MTAQNMIFRGMNVSAKALCIGALALGLTTSSFAQGVDGDQPENGPAPSQMHKGMNVMKTHKHGLPFLRGINLTPEQSAQLKQMRQKQHAQSIEKRKALHEQHQALTKLVMSDDYSPDKADAIIARIGAIQADLQKQRAESGHQLYQILTPEQRVKLQQNLAKGNEMRRHRHMR